MPPQKIPLECRISIPFLFALSIALIFCGLTLTICYFRLEDEDLLRSGQHPGFPVDAPRPNARHKLKKKKVLAICANQPPSIRNKKQQSLDSAAAVNDEKEKQPIALPSPAQVRQLRKLQDEYTKLRKQHLSEALRNNTFGAYASDSSDDDETSVEDISTMDEERLNAKIERLREEISSSYKPNSKIQKAMKLSEPIVSSMDDRELDDTPWQETCKQMKQRKPMQVDEDGDMSVENVVDSDNDGGGFELVDDSKKVSKTAIARRRRKKKLAEGQQKIPGLVY